MSAEMKAAYKPGTPLMEMLKDGWARSFDAKQTVSEAKASGYVVDEAFVKEVWAGLESRMQADLATPTPPVHPDVKRYEWLRETIIKAIGSSDSNEEFDATIDQGMASGKAYETAANLAQSRNPVPQGWTINRHANGEIGICSTKEGPGYMVLTQDGGRLEQRMLFALADAILKRDGR